MEGGIILGEGEEDEKEGVVKGLI
jgi:hypothetical protein